MRIIIGSAQFGMSYGIANTSGQVKKTELISILDYASKMGLDTIDTAIAYGESEKSLGEAGVNRWNIITKLPEIPNDCLEVSSWVINHVHNSLNRLGVKTLSGLLLHRPNQILDQKNSDLWPTLLKLKSEGVVEKIGFSIYSPNELNNLWGKYKPDLVQCPYSVLDQSLNSSGWLERMNSEGVEIHVRSIFLQGLLLMNKNSRPEKFNKWNELWDTWDTWLKDKNVSALHAAVSFALSDTRISKIVIGIDSLIQLEEILSVAAYPLENFPVNLSSLDKELINPSYWEAL